MMEQVQDELNINMNFTNAGDHVPEADRNNRTIEERIRVAYHHLPYKVLPRVMIRYLAMVSTDKLNYLPVKGGVSPYFSPQMIVGQTNLEYEKHCSVLFGAYVQASHDTNPTNTNEQRTVDAIYLRPYKNIQGGHEVMDLHTA